MRMLHFLEESLRLGEWQLGRWITILIIIICRFVKHEKLKRDYCTDPNGKSWILLKSVTCLSVSWSLRGLLHAILCFIGFWGEQIQPGISIFHNQFCRNFTRSNIQMCFCLLLYHKLPQFWELTVYVNSPIKELSGKKNLSHGRVEINKPKPI